MLDLDETLVHCVDEGEPADMHVVVRLPMGGLIIVFILIR